jgi:hypothetical protein
VRVADGATVDAGTAGKGNGGPIQIEARSVKVNGGFLFTESGHNGGKAGPITINADTITVADGGSVSSSSSGNGDAGSIQMSAGTIELAGKAEVAVSSPSSTAGTIELTASRSLSLANSKISADGLEGGEVCLGATDQVYLLNSIVTATSRAGKGGNIAIPHLSPDQVPPQDPVNPQEPPPDCMPGMRPQFVILNRTALTARSESGQGGNVGIEAAQYVRSADSMINVSGTSGQSGKEDVPKDSFDFATALPELRAVFVEQVPEWKPPLTQALSDPGGYTFIGSRRRTEAEGRRRIILQR